jgi:hypothetical protein
MKFWKNFHSGSVLVIALISVLSAFLMWSCYPDSGLTSASDFDVIVTQYDTEKDYSTFTTYFLVDSIEHIVPEGEEDNINREFDEQILNQVAKILELKYL